VGGLSWDTHGITEDEDKKAQGAGKRHPKGVYVRAATFHVIGMIHPGLRVRAPGCLRVSFHFSFSSAPQLVLISTLITTRTRKGGSVMFKISITILKMNMKFGYFAILSFKKDEEL
jgi:hypothetical protein